MVTARRRRVVEASSAATSSTARRMVRELRLTHVQLTLAPRVSVCIYKQLCDCIYLCASLPGVGGGGAQNLRSLISLAHARQWSPAPGPSSQICGGGDIREISLIVTKS